MSHQNEVKDGVNLGRHRAQCKICLSSERENVEMLFLDWQSPYAISDFYRGKFSVDSIYRHIHAVKLYRKRLNNLGVALQKIIERVDQVTPTASSVLAAIKTVDKMNRDQQQEKLPSSQDPREVLGRMSREERQCFVETGRLPDWFPIPGSVTSIDDEGTDGDDCCPKLKPSVAEEKDDLQPEGEVHLEVAESAGVEQPVTQEITDAPPEREAQQELTESSETEPPSADDTDGLPRGGPIPEAQGVSPDADSHVGEELSTSAEPVVPVREEESRAAEPEVVDDQEEGVISAPSGDFADEDSPASEQAINLRIDQTDVEAVGAVQ